MHLSSLSNFSKSVWPTVGVDAVENARDGMYFRQLAENLFTKCTRPMGQAKSVTRQNASCLKRVACLLFSSPSITSRLPCPVQHLNMSADGPRMMCRMSNIKTSLC
ncbi:unnamed protein product, partial [Ectocarpus sp. 4 AP-2014]